MMLVLESVLQLLGLDSDPMTVEVTESVLSELDSEFALVEQKVSMMDSVSAQGSGLVKE